MMNNAAHLNIVTETK